MLKGVHITLLIGPGLPVPAPKSVMDSLLSLKVTSGKDKSGFQLTFAVGKKSELLNTMLPAGYFDPMITRVIILVTLGGMPNVIMDGIVTHQELAPSNEPSQSTLTITGEDLSVVMDVVEMNFMRYPAMPEVARLYVILAKYLFFGIVPIVIPPIPPDIPIPTREIPTHRGTDLANVNMDALTNVESMSFSLDGLAKKIVIYTVMDPVTMKIPIPIPVPNISILRPPLGARLTPPAKIEFADDGTAQSTPKAIQKILGMTFNASDAITVSGTLDVVRYGGVLRSRMLVGVRGAGLAYDGLYYVNTVTHEIKRGQYKQNFQLSRDGLISITPKVPV
ncbi:MAG: hypothetical protein HYX46_07570 [Betaproteobacteria bacterium]|nr:hypothetical protein [Betaproteobacteria bacterium]